MPGFTPDMVYNIVAGNPNLRSLVEQTANLATMQQQMQQMTPMLNQMAQNPLQSAQGYMNWQQNQMAPPNGVNYPPQGQPAPMIQSQMQPQPAVPQNTQAPVANSQQNVNGGQQMPNPMEMAQQAYTEVMGNFQAINNNIKGLYDLLEKIEAKLPDWEVPPAKGNPPSGSKKGSGSDN